MRWASNPPRHYVEPEFGQSLINSPELRDSWLRLSNQQVRRGNSEPKEEWEIRKQAAARIRKQFKRRLAEAHRVAEGCLIPEEQDFEILPVPFAGTDLNGDEKVSLLAAIYDECVPGTRIDPWQDSNSFSERILAIPYVTLTADRVKKLRQHWDTHRTKVELYFIEVEKELAASSRKRRGRKRANYKTEQREAELASEWVRARNLGTSKVDFVKEKGTTLKEFKKLLGRVAGKKRPSKK
jgi:hypothetical protein